MSHATFTDTKVELKDLVLQTLRSADKKVLLEILLIRVFNLAKSRTNVRETSMSYASFVLAMFIEAMYSNIDFISSEVGKKLDYISAGYFPEKLSANIGLILVECLNRTYEDIFEISGSHKFSSLDMEQIGGAGQALFTLKTSDELIIKIVEECKSAFFHDSLSNVGTA